MFVRRDGAVNVGAGALVILDPIIIANWVKDLARAEGFCVGLCVADKARRAHVLEHRLLPWDPVREFLVEFLAGEKGRDGEQAHGRHNGRGEGIVG